MATNAGLPHCPIKIDNSDLLCNPKRTECSLFVVTLILYVLNTVSISSARIYRSRSILEYGVLSLTYVLDEKFGDNSIFKSRKPWSSGSYSSLLVTLFATV